MLNQIEQNDISIKLRDERIQQQCSNEICLKFIDAPMFFSLANHLLYGRQSSAIARNNSLSAWCPSQRIQHALCPSLSVVPFQCPKWYFSVADLYKDKHKHCNRFQVSVLFIQSNIRDFNIHVTIKNSTFVNLQVQSGKEHLGTYTRRRAADVARYIARYRFSSDNADLRNFSLEMSSVLSMTNT